MKGDLTSVMNAANCSDLVHSLQLISILILERNLTNGRIVARSSVKLHLMQNIKFTQERNSTSVMIVAKPLLHVPTSLDIRRGREGEIERDVQNEGGKLMKKGPGRSGSHL